MNQFNVIGNFTKNPEIRITTSGTKVATVNIAVNRTYKKEGQSDTDFFRISAFGKVAELLEAYTAKGSKVRFTCRIENNNYEKDGKTVYSDSIIATEVEFLNKVAKTEGQAAPVAQPAQAAPVAQAAPAQATPPGFVIEDDDEDMPF